MFEDGYGEEHRVLPECANDMDFNLVRTQLELDPKFWHPDSMLHTQHEYGRDEDMASDEDEEMGSESDDY